MKRFFCASLFALFSTAVNAQEWTYYPEDELSTLIAFSWVDQDGSSYHNLARFKTTGNASEEINRHMLILDKNGRFKGIIRVAGCNNRSLLLPFAKDQFVASGPNCNSTGGDKLDTRVFDAKGKLVKSGYGLYGNNFAQIRTESGYTIFNESLFSSARPYLRLGNLDWNFNLNSGKIDLSPLLIPGKGMLNKYVPPVQTADQGWIIPMHYGLLDSDGQAMSPESGIVYKTDGQQVLWRFPRQLTRQMVYDVVRMDDNYGVLMGWSLFDNKTLYVLSNEGQLVDSLVLPAKGYYLRTLVHDNQILITTRTGPIGNQEIHLYRFDFQGNMLEDRTLNDRRNGFVYQMKPFGPHSILLSGTVTKTDGNNQAFVWKIDLGRQEPDEQLPIPGVSNSTIEYVNTNALSASLFPNPASIEIHIAIENQGFTVGYALRVFNTAGVLVRDETFKGLEYTLDIAGLAPGVYTYVILRTDAPDKPEYVSGKFVKI